MRSIFWKIFMVLWLTSIVIAGVGTVLVTKEIIQEQQKIQWEQSFKPEIESRVSQYEMWGKRFGGRNRVFRQSFNPGIDIIVLDEQSGDLVYGDRSKLNSREWNNTTYTSRSGKSYRVKIPRLEASVIMGFYAYVQQTNPFRMWLTLLVSGVFSLLLSYVIIRPIKRLQTHIDIMGSGELDTRLDRKLTKRRDEFGSLSRSFNFMAERIQSLVGSKQQLLHDVSHELRAPLARLQVAGELARCEAEVAGIGSDMYDRVDRECGALNKLIDEILTLSRVEAGGVNHYDRDPCDLKALMERMISDARFLHSQRDISLKVDGAKREIHIPVTMLEKAFKNILENAIKYSPEEAPVEVTLAFDKKRVVLSVGDRGPGMSQDDLDNIFTPFYRAKAYNSKEGYGLGMSITQKSVQQLGGEINAENRRGGGLKVSISMPL